MTDDSTPDRIPDDVIDGVRWFTSTDTALTVGHWRERLAEAIAQGVPAEGVATLAEWLRRFEDEDRDMTVYEEGAVKREAWGGR